MNSYLVIRTNTKNDVKKETSCDKDEDKDENSKQGEGEEEEVATMQASQWEGEVGECEGVIHLAAPVVWVTKVARLLTPPQSFSQPMKTPEHHYTTLQEPITATECPGTLVGTLSNFSELFGQ